MIIIINQWWLPGQFATLRKSLRLNSDFLYQERDVIDICHAIAAMNGNTSFANPIGTLSCKCLCLNFFETILKWIAGLVLVLEKVRMPSLSETPLEGISLWLRWIPQGDITRWYWLVIYLITLVPEIVIEISMLDIFFFIPHIGLLNGKDHINKV